LEKSIRIAEPEPDRADVGLGFSVKVPEGPMTVADVFSLSGGAMKSGARTANRIDGLLTKMIQSPNSCKYVGDIDQNLDYLFTHLQLDIIGRMAEERGGEEETKVVEEPPPEPAIPLDRVRLSI
jgi:hypothetical protein